MFCVQLMKLLFKWKISFLNIPWHIYWKIRGGHNWRQCANLIALKSNGHRNMEPPIFKGPKPGHLFLKLQVLEKSNVQKMGKFLRQLLYSAYNVCANFHSNDLKFIVDFWLIWYNTKKPYAIMLVRRALMSRSLSSSSVHSTPSHRLEHTNFIFSTNMHITTNIAGHCGHYGACIGSFAY